MARSIVIPLYPHTTDEEIGELLEELRRIGVDDAQLINSYVPADDADARAVLVATRFSRLLVERPDWSEDESARVAAYWPRLSPEHGGSTIAKLEDEADALLDRTRPRPRMLEAVGDDVPAIAAPLVTEHGRTPDGDRRLTVQAPLELRRARILEPDSFRDHHEEIGYHRSLVLLKLASEPIDGRPGWRVDRQGREWYSAAWLEAVS